MSDPLVTYQFLCNLHDVELVGYPGWYLASSEPDRFAVAFSGFTCPAPDGRACADDWSVVTLTRLLTQGDLKPWDSEANDLTREERDDILKEIADDIDNGE